MRSSDQHRCVGSLVWLTKLRNMPIPEFQASHVGTSGINLQMRVQAPIFSLGILTFPSEIARCGP